MSHLSLKELFNQHESQIHDWVMKSLSNAFADLDCSLDLSLHRDDTEILPTLNLNGSTLELYPIRRDEVLEGMQYWGVNYPGLSRERRERMRGFFEMEIRNEEHGGVSPSTLNSALDSATQFPENHHEDFPTKESLEHLEEDIRKLMGFNDDDTELSDLLEAA